ncbi:transposase [Algoriphagus persicinus]|uniref:transposase n=1 Tax=Algoriphagus persicinus TaxID=3108754 RepID=UPI002B3C3EFA|nr:transposase [Algoriphagus sp. E1-3-M2]MEB2784728.1 transposase [Algoriphagus sp. E1-3-M2]
MHLNDTNNRNSSMEYDQVYFWTDTIKGWKKLFTNDLYKQIILDSFGELVSREMVKIYAFVIMPNHLHIIWEMKEPNGKEMPHASFNKFTSHSIAKDLKSTDPILLSNFLVDEPDRKLRIWQRDPLAVLMDTKKKAEQKIDYLHLNPLQSHWNLANRPEDYKWSSAAFYEIGVDEFGFLTDYRDRF